MDITPYLKLMVDKSASDLFFHVGAPVNIKIGGVVRPIGNKVLGPGQVREIGYSVMKDDQIKQFEHDWELNFAIPLHGVEMCIRDSALTSDTGIYSPDCASRPSVPQLTLEQHILAQRVTPAAGPQSLLQIPNRRQGDAGPTGADDQGGDGDLQPIQKPLLQKR